MYLNHLLYGFISNDTIRALLTLYYSNPESNDYCKCFLDNIYISKYALLFLVLIQIKKPEALLRRYWT